MEAEATYDVALVLDEAPAHFSQAEAALHQLRQAFQDHLIGTDILFLDPSLLVCLLHFEAGLFDPRVVTHVALEARRGGFRVLKPMLLSKDARERFYRERLARFSFREMDVGELEPVFDVLRSRLLRNVAGPPKERPRDAQPVFSLRYRDEQEFLDSFHPATAARPGCIFIGSQAVPRVGTSIGVSLELDSGQGPIDLYGEVLATEENEAATVHDGRRGFRLGLFPSAQELSYLESFLIAVQRCAPWPERSGRRYERFPIRLPVEYEGYGVPQREYTGNISRGGVFLQSAHPPPQGSRLRLRLYAAGRVKSVELAGEVVHVITPTMAVAQGCKPGAGIRFAESAATIRSGLEEILGSATVPVVSRAMVVDDDRFFRVVLGNVLRVGGFEVLEAADGTEAFETLLYQLLRLDVLILDLYMPGMPAAELVELVRSVGGEEDLVVIVLTGAQLSEEDKQELSAFGADDVISKSTSPEDILRRVEGALQEKSKP